MTNRHIRLTPVSPEAFQKLEEEANDLVRLQSLLNRLPLGLQIEDLSDTALERLRQIANAATEELCGPNLLKWNNMCRQIGDLGASK